MSLELSNSSISWSRVLIALVVNGCAVKHHRFSPEMKLELLLFMGVIKWCSGAGLNPLENNDKLQDITNLYVAEWQWESWPVKQDLPEQEGRSPSQRRNMALWRDSSGSAWYLFGGQPVSGDLKKVFSDVWKFTVRTRAWKRLFPSQTELKGVYKNKTGGTISPRGNLLDESDAFYHQLALQSTVLCGGIEKSNPVKVKKLKAWSNFRRKVEMEETEDKLASLAVYAPKTSKSNTVWQIDAKSKLWTAYVCCCDTSKNKNENSTSNSTITLSDKNKMCFNQTVEKNFNPARNECSVLDSKINKAEDEMDKEQQHFKIDNLRNKKKKINQIKSNGDKLFFKKIKIEKRGTNKINEKAVETKLPPNKNLTEKSEKRTVEAINSMKISKKEESTSKVKIPAEEKNHTGESKNFKMASKYCPEYSESDTSVTWCDGRNEAIISSDISLPQITLWIFSLRTTHWSQQQVNISAGIEWPACSSLSSARYAGKDANVYIICSRAKTTTNDFLKAPEDSTDPSKIPLKDNFNEKLVFRINYKENILCDLGSIQLNSYFNSPEGERLWRNESQAILQVVGSSDNETILVLAYLDLVDLWVLSKDHEGKESFHLVEKIWRGSALKWFDKYNSALYSLQFVSESGNSETILLPNPRKIGVNEYWPRERGRFIIRIFRNENLKNQSFENRTREQNLTYELLQSDYKPSGPENHLNQVYNLKVLIFFGISSTIFSVIGVALFLKRCVNCPSRIQLRNECQKSPLVIRYSVIPDDLLYPVA